MSKIWKRVLYCIGSGLGLIGVIFVVRRLYSYSEELDFHRFDTSAWLLTGVLCVVYGAANLFLAVGWRKLLYYFQIRVSVKQAVRLFGLSQLAKYVPGNIFHLAGRQALAMASGLPAKPLAKSALWELGCFVFVGALFAPIISPLVFKLISTWLSLTLFFVGLLIVLVVIRKLFAATVRDALLYQCSFLMLSGVVFVALLYLVSPQSCEIGLLSALCGAYIISWLAGFVTPGAPAGVGVRELVLLFLLQGLVSEADLLLTVVLGRIVTVVGDLLFFLTALLLRDAKAVLRTHDDGGE